MGWNEGELNDFRGVGFGGRRTAAGDDQRMFA